MLVTLKLYLVVTEPGPAICELSGMPLGSIASVYILARNGELAAQRASEVIGRLITRNQVVASDDEPWARALIVSKVLSRQHEVVVVGHHAHQSRSIVRVPPGQNHGEIIGEWEKVHGYKTMTCGGAFAVLH